MAGVGVGCTVCRRAMALHMRIGMVCYGVCRYGAMAYVWRWCALGVYVWLACVWCWVYALGVRVYVDTLTW